MTDINITHQKQGFLTSQIRLLSTPLTTPTSSINSSLPSTTLDSLLTKINKQFASHNRLVFGIQSQRHVAEQIDALYWQDVLRDGLPVYSAADGQRTVVKREVDLTDSCDVERSLGEEWDDVCLRPSKRPRRTTGLHVDKDDDEREAELQAEEEDEEEDVNDEGEPSRAQRYASLRGNLVVQVRQRDELRRKLAQYRKLQELLRPLENAKENVQPNLVTRDNVEIEAELARMRVLLARAGNAIRMMPSSEGLEDREEPVVDTPEERLEGLLALG